jgi:hypothetical protein
MTLYIARNGEKLGPFSLAETQELARNGSVLPTDLAWYEGLATWIPLSQVPGFDSTTPAPAPMPGEAQPPARRPVLVWVICVIMFILILFGILALAVQPVLNNMMMSKMPAAQLELVKSQGWWNYYLPTLVTYVLTLFWAIELFRLKRDSIYFFLTAIVLGIVVAIINLSNPAFLNFINSSPVTAAVAWISMFVAWSINFALLYYTWHLIRKGVLK